MPQRDPPTAIELLARALLTVEGRALLCRDRRHGHAYLPGGHVEPGESAAEATARELREELGLEVRVGPPLLAWEARFTQRGKPKHEWTIVFHVEPLAPLSAGTPPSSLEADLSFEFGALDELPGLNVRPAPVAAWLAAHQGGPPGMHWLSIDERE